MSVHYKFKSALDFDTITFDGLHISVADLKKSIVQQKRLGKTADFDLQITNAQTKEEYGDNLTLIPKNTSLIIARIPLSAHAKKAWDPQAEKVQHHRLIPEPERGDLDISQMNGSEEDKIQAMMAQSTVDYDPNKYQKLRGQSQTGEVPATYRCFKCHKPGHWIKNCPMNVIIEPAEPTKRSTGIPRSFLQDKESQEKLEKIPPPQIEKKQEIPDDLICSICKDLFTDAVMIPCCGSSFCDECVRTALLESEDNECPDCNEKGSSPGSLIPNRFLRNSVNSFKNETGYSKPKPVKEKSKETIVAPVVIQEVPVQKPVVQDVQKEITTKPQKEITKKTNVEMPAPEKPVSEKFPAPEKPEHSDKKHDPHSSHDEIESDYEDNITVTLPPAHLQSHRPSYHDRPFNGSRHARNPRPPGMENSPKYNQMSPGRELENNYHQSEEMQGPVNNIEMKHQSHMQPLPRDSSMRQQHRPLDGYGHMQQQMNPYPPNMQGMPPHPSQMRPYDNNYGMHHPGYNMPQYPIRGPYPGNRMGYGGPMPMVRPRHIVPQNNLASVYQGVQAKVGTGIIDDPLEAFNRIMREKEKRKEERRRSPERRRSRSIENRRLRSPPPQHFQRPRHEIRRIRSPVMIRDRRGRSRNREKRPNEMEKRRHRSSSFSDRSSRSRSWSNPPPIKRRSKTPINLRRRSRSRTPSYSASRSRSRSHSKGRFRGPPVNHGRYNRSPLKSVSPRYRQKENRPRREEFREASPYHVQRRPRSRLRSPPHNRQEKQMGYDHFNYQNPSPPSHESGFRNPPPKRYSRERQDNFNRNERIDRNDRNDRNDHYESSRDAEFKPEGKFEDAPPGTVEPPPPGFERSPPAPEHSWEYPFDEHENYGRISNQRFDDKDPNVMPNSNLRQLNEERPREERSWSKTSMYSPQSLPLVEKRRKTHSRTPPRVEPSFENNLRKEKIKDRSDHHDLKRFDNKKYDKSNSDRSKERKSHDVGKEKSKDYLPGRILEKDIKSSIKEKEREKEKKSNEKEKRIENSDEEKKDKKLKDRKKKKKDKEEKELKKKNKKDKKDKEKKEKLKLKSKDGEDDEEKLENNEELAMNNNPPTIYVSIDNTVPLNIPQNLESTNENLSQDIEEPEPIKLLQQEVVNTLDLYGDICQAEDIKFDYVNTSTEDGEILEEAEDPNNKQFNRFDSILDIHDFETSTDLDGLNTTNESRKQQVLVILPEPSKWELDDDGGIKDDKMKNIESGFEVNDEGKVTSEVLKRAESAIFSRAINAIRPIEIKKVSVERQKLYSDKEMIEMTPPKEERPTFQVTVPTNNLNNMTNTRCVEIKEEKKSIKETKEEKKSVKDRLGVKVTDSDFNNFNQDKSLTPPPHKYTAPEEYRKPKRSRSREKVNDKKDEVREKSKNFKPFDEYKRSKNRDFRNDKPPSRFREPDRNKSPFRFARDHFRDRRSRERDRDRNPSENNRIRDSRINRSFEKKRDRSRSLSIDKKRLKQDKIEKTNYDSKNKDNKDNINKDNYNKDNINKEKAASLKKKILEIVEAKKEKRLSVHESTSTSSNSGSDSDSDDNKKKKRKHKKEKKQSRRSSSNETKSSGKRKRSKSKKKNKAAKKKKKSKK